MDRRTTHRLVAGGLVAGAALQLSEMLLWPPGSEQDGAAMIRAAGTHSDRYLTASVFETLSWLAIGPALVAVIVLVSGRGRGLTRVGATILLVGGSVGALVTTTMNVVAVTLGRQPDARAAYATWHDLTASPVLLGFVVVLIGSGLGLPLMASGLARAGLVGWWFPVLTVVALVSTEMVEGAGSWPLKVAFDLPYLASVLTLARVLVTERPVAAAATGREPAGVVTA